MKKLLTALTAAAIGLGTFAATGASAQMSSTRVHTERTTVTREAPRRYYHQKRAHRVCNTVWRHHQKVRRCRTVWR